MSACCSDHAVVVGGQPVDARLVQRVDHLAVHVELELLVRGVADAHRRRALVAGQPVELALGEPPLARDAVHDLQRSPGSPATARSSQSRQARASSREAGVHQRVAA